MSAAPSSSPFLYCHGNADVTEETGLGVYCVFWKLRLGYAVTTATALWPRLLPGVSEEAGHGHQ